MRRIWTIILSILMLTVWSPGAAESSVPAAANIMEQCAASAVRLEVFNANGDRIGTGSGFVAFDPPVLVTACHVIVNMAYMIATRDDGTTFRIDRAIDADEEIDIALCALPEDAMVDPLPMAAFRPARGDGIIAIGSQFGLVNLVSLGNVCGWWKTEETDWILFSAPISAGCSGGPLLNDAGEVTGVIIGSYDQAQNLNIAAPAEAAVALYGSDMDKGGNE